MAAHPQSLPNQDYSRPAQELPQTRQRLTQESPVSQETPDGPTALIESSPKKHGGRRPGAGRKSNLQKVLRDNIRPVTAAVILAQQDEIKLWTQLLRHPDARIRLDALKYCTDRRDGKAKQAIEHLGPDGGPLQAAVLVKFVEPKK